MHGNIAGTGTFKTPDGWVYWASVDVPYIETLVHNLQSALEGHGFPIRRDHGLTPHISLKYLNSHELQEHPLTMTQQIPLDFSNLTLALGEQHQDFPMGKGQSWQIQHTDSQPIVEQNISF